MGQDGLRGAEALVGQGSSVLAQDRATSIVWGMPGFVAQAGLAERVLALDDFPAEIVRRAQAGRSRGAESSPPTSRKRH